MPNARPAPDDIACSARKRGVAGFSQDLRSAYAGGPALWWDLARAVFELARANVFVRHAAPARLGLLVDSSVQPPVISAAHHRLVDRVAYAVNIMSLRVPWRSDCLVRAVAARRWLAGGGVASRIGIGARHGEDGAFMAHAWLMVGERIVTGGDATPYQEFLRTKT